MGFLKKVARARRIKAIRDARQSRTSKKYPDFEFSTDIWAFGNYELKQLFSDGSESRWIKVFDSTAQIFADSQNFLLRRVDKS